MKNPMVLKRFNNVSKKEFSKIFEKIGLDKYFYLIDSISSLLENNSEVCASFNLNRNLFYSGEYNKFLKVLKRKKIANVEIFKKLSHLTMELIEEENNVLVNYNNNLLESRRKIQKFFIENPDQASSFLLTNPSINHSFHNYLNTDVEKHKRRHRKNDHPFYNYITRSIMKTSPFAFSTSISNTEYPAPMEHNVELNLTLIYKIIFHYLENSNEFLSNVKFALPPSTINSEYGNLFFEAIVNSNKSTSKKILFGEEGIIKFQINHQMANFLKNYDLDEYFDFYEFREQLFPDESYEKVITLISQLVQKNIFIPVVGFKEGNSESLILDALDRLKGIEPILYQEMKLYLSSLLKLKNSLSLDFSPKNLEQNIEKYTPIIEEINATIGTKFLVTEAFYVVTFKNNVNTPIKFETIVSENDLIDLKIIQRFGQIFNASQRLKFEVVDRLKLVFDEDEKIFFDDQFQNVIFEVSELMKGYWGDFLHTNSNFISPLVESLDKIKIQFIEQLNDLVISQSQNEFINLKELILEYVNKIPKSICSNNIDSTFFLQKGNGNKLIINNCYEGQEKYSARFMNIFQTYISTSRTYHRFVNELYEKNNYYEITDTFGFNGNMKINTLKKRCYTNYIGNSRFISTKDDINIDKCYMKIASNDLDLYDENDNKFRILHRGSLTPALMPGYISNLLQIFSNGAMYFRFSEMIHSDSIPELRFDNLVLSRKVNKLSVFSEISDILSLTNEEQKFLFINKLFKEYCINTIFFLRFNRNYEHENKYNKLKPMCYDIKNPLSCKFFIKTIMPYIKAEMTDEIFIEEYLDDCFEYTTEYQIEVYQYE
ncbi:hypothetical protein ACXZ8K_08150 [Streptococcus agalactiae]